MDPAANRPKVWGTNRVSAILEDHSGALWVGCTSGWGTEGGLYRLNRDSNTFVPYPYDPDDPRSLIHDNVLSLYQDRQGILWIGTLEGGLSRTDRSDRRFATYWAVPTTPNGLQGGGARGIYLGPDDVLWIGSSDGILNRLDRQSGSYTGFR